MPFAILYALSFTVACGMTLASYCGIAGECRDRSASEDIR